MADFVETLTDSLIDESIDSIPTNLSVEHNGGEEEPPKKRRGRPKGSKNRSSIEIDEGSPAFAEMGTVMATTVTASMTMLLGQDWRAEQPELDAMQMAWSKYFEATGMQEFPPWAMLAMVHVGYVGKRLTMPETKSRLRRLFDRIRRRKASAYPDNGNDELGQNNAG